MAIQKPKKSIKKASISADQNKNLEVYTRNWKTNRNQVDGPAPEEVANDFNNGTLPWQVPEEWSLTHQSLHTLFQDGPNEKPEERPWPLRNSRVIVCPNHKGDAQDNGNQNEETLAEINEDTTTNW